MPPTKNGSKFGRGARDEFELQGVEHFLPSESAAIDHAVGGFELEDFGVGDARAAEADFVEADDHAGVAVEGDEGRDVADDAGEAADHRHAADAAELMDGDAAPEVGALTDFDVAAEHRAVGKDDVVVDDAVVGGVGIHHEQAAIADASGVASVERAVDRDVFAKDVAVADFGGAGVFRHVNMLRHAADHGAFEDQIVAAKDGTRLNGDAAGEVTAVAEDDAGFDDAEGTDPNVGAKFSVGANDSKRVNRHRRVLCEGSEIRGRSPEVGKNHWTPDA